LVICQFFYLYPKIVRELASGLEDSADWDGWKVFKGENLAEIALLHSSNIQATLCGLFST
jgi:hypothetical protein